MKNKLIFIYDGECPFCNYFAELLELKSNLPNLQIKDARDKPPEMPCEYDIDKKGAILINEGTMLYGANAINYICSQIENPSDGLLEILRVVFSSGYRTKLIFPFLLISRRIALLLKGISRNI